MANATAGTVNTTVANGFLARPAGDTLDTGTSAVSLDYDLGGTTNDVIFEVTNNMASAINITVGLSAGDYPPAFKSQIGGYTSGNLAQNAVGIYGPFSSAQFIRNGTKAGKVTVTITPASGTIAATIRCYKIAKLNN